MTDVFVATPLLAALVDAAEEIGLDRARLVAAAGLDEEKLADPDRIVPEPAERALWDAMLAQSDDTSIGILVAQRFPRGALRVLEYLVRSSPTLGMGLRLVPRFNQLLRSYSVHTITEEPAGLRTVLDRDYDIRSRAQIASIESGVALYLHIARDATGILLAPTEVTFRHARSSAEEVYDLLGPHVGFERPDTGILIDRKSLTVPMLDADPTLNDILQRCARQRIAELPHAAPTTMRVHQALLGLVPRHEPTLEAVAVVLETSPRALQRQLHAEDTTFRAVVERVREQVAKRYLAEAELTTVDVAMLLDYSDAPSFHRAFRRWTGMSPGAYRRSLSA
jgi:AraC-like DNA-binding protein